MVNATVPIRLKLAHVRELAHGTALRMSSVIYVLEALNQQFLLRGCAALKAVVQIPVTRALAVRFVKNQNKKAMTARSFATADRIRKMNRGNAAI